MVSAKSALRARRPYGVRNRLGHQDLHGAAIGQGGAKQNADAGRSRRRPAARLHAAEISGQAHHPARPGDPIFRPATPAQQYAAEAARQSLRRLRRRRTEDFPRRLHIAARARRQLRIFQPGFGLLGYAMSAQAGRPYADLVREQISLPLGMESTGATLTPTMQARLAPGHDAAGTPVANWDMDALSGAGALRSDAQDLIRYLQTLMRQRSGDSAYALVQTPQRSTSMRDGRIGLAWHLNPLRATPIVWHNGMTGGYASYVGYTADGKRGVVVLTNTAASVDAIAMASLVPGAPPERKAVPLAAEVLADYDGRYQLAPGFILSVHPSARGLTTQ